MKLLILLFTTSCVIKIGECDKPTDPVVHQEKAVQMARAFYHTPPDFPDPGIEWEPERCLDLHDGKCYSGYYVTGCNLIVASNFSPTDVFWVLAHEMYHVHLFALTGDPDAFHKDPGFQPGGKVDQLRTILEAL